jgi:hypothetical protein
MARALNSITQLTSNDAENNGFHHKWQDLVSIVLTDGQGGLAPCLNQ